MRVAPVNRLLICALVSAAALSLGRLAEAQTARQIASKSFPSVVLITMEDANGQPLSLGSGFFVDKGVIATNLHVVEGAAGGNVKLVGQGGG